MHEYMRRINIAIAKGVIDAGAVAHVFVAHDSNCGIYNGNDCDCDPDITIKTQQGPVMVQKDGTLVKGHDA